MRETINHQLGGINNQITDEFGADNDMKVTGGGRGWTASTTLNGATVQAKGTSKLDAANRLYEQIKASFREVLEPDEGDFEGMSPGEAARCVAECMTSIKPYCECRCDGANHGAGAGIKAILLVSKECACGCGGITNRRFVPGHDARFHAAEKARAAGFSSVEEFRVKQKADRNARAATKRRAKRAAIKAGAAKVAEAVKEGRLAPKPVRIRPTNQTPARGFVKHNDDLPF